MATYAKAVTLTSIRTFNNKKEDVESVVFQITPEVSESRTVSYVDISDVRLPSSILIWTGSPSRNFTIGAKLFARTEAEADLAFKYKSLLQSWTVSNVNYLNGSNFNQTNVTDLAVGASGGDFLFSGTPDVLYLEGYGGQLRRIPVVITALNITYPTDVDYIQTSGRNPDELHEVTTTSNDISYQKVSVPIIQDISITLKEAREIDAKDGRSISSFNMENFKAGILPYW